MTTRRDLALSGAVSAAALLALREQAKADTAFTSFAFPVTGQTTLRTMPNRLVDVINVLDFGADPSGSTDSQPAIQAAFNSQRSILFPPGTYTQNSAVLIPDDNAARVIFGAGQTSLIQGSFPDYLWKTLADPNGGIPISSVDGLQFNQNYNAGTNAITSVDPPGVRNATTPPVNEGTISNPYNGMGCCYVQGSWMRWSNVKFIANSGICLYMPGINNYLANFQTSCNYGGATAAPFQCGVWGSNCTIADGKPGSARFGIITIQGPTILRNMDVERCQYGMLVGENPIIYWDRNTNKNIAVFDSSSGGGYLHVDTINFESCGSNSQGGAGMIVSATVMDLENLELYFYGQIGPADYGLRVDGGSGIVRNAIVGGNQVPTGFTGNGAGFAVGAGQLAGISFENCQARTGGTDWAIIPTPGSNFNTTSCSRLVRCDSDGAVPFASLGYNNRMGYGQQLICISDCPDPLWQTTTDATHLAPYSNVGKPVTTGGGSNKVMVRSTGSVAIPSGAAWSPGNTTITMSVSGPGRVLPGMVVRNINTANLVGVVSSYTGTTLTLVAGAANGGSSGDLVGFDGWVIAA